MFQAVTLQIRQLGIDELSNALCYLVESYAEQFVSNDFSLNQMNRPKIHQMLARMTDYVDSRSGQPSLYRDYLKRWGASALSD